MRGKFQTSWTKLNKTFKSKSDCASKIGPQVKSVERRVKKKKGGKVETTKSGVAITGGSAIIIAQYFCYAKGVDPRKK